MRWSAAVQPAPKGDRLVTAALRAGSKVVFMNDPFGRMTVAQKVNEQRPAGRPSPIREIPTPPVRKPQDENAGKAKNVMDGCEPSFSPVTVPSMAQVAGRCIAAREPASKVASLAR